MKMLGMTLAERMREALAGKRAVIEKKMFGGTCFLLRGHMLCCTGKQGFMFRVGRKKYALKRWIGLAEDYVFALPPKRRAR